MFTFEGIRDMGCLGEDFAREARTQKLPVRNNDLNSEHITGLQNS